jgi:hypothetical protein
MNDTQRYNTHDMFFITSLILGVGGAWKPVFSVCKRERHIGADPSFTRNEGPTTTAVLRDTMRGVLSVIEFFLQEFPGSYRARGPTVEQYFPDYSVKNIR